MPAKGGKKTAKGKYGAGCDWAPAEVALFLKNAGCVRIEKTGTQGSRGEHGNKPLGGRSGGKTHLQGILYFTPT